MGTFAGPLLRVNVDLEVMAMKKYSIHSRYPELEPHLQMFDIWWWKFDVYIKHNMGRRIDFFYRIKKIYL